MRRIFAPAFLRDAEQRERGRDLAGAAGDDEEIALADRRRGHVADHRDAPPEMEEPHGEAHDLQALAAAAEDDHGLRLGDHLHRLVDGAVVDPVEARPPSSASAPA